MIKKIILAIKCSVYNFNICTEPAIFSYIGAGLICLLPEQKPKKKGGEADRPSQALSLTEKSTEDSTGG